MEKDTISVEKTVICHEKHDFAMKKGEYHGKGMFSHEKKTALPWNS